MKNYVGISRDHSGSMRHIARAAARDYNSKVTSIREASQSNNLDTIVSVVECGYGNTDQVRRAVVNSSAMVLEQINEQKYQADGHGTPLWDSVGELIEIFENVPDYADKTVSFMVMAITDGEENSSRKYSAAKIAAKIKELNNTDRWTFVFRVPRGYGRKIAALGIPQGNIQEWEQTDKGVEIAARKDVEAFTTYFSEKSRGITSSSKFYADLSNVSSSQVAAALEDVSKDVLIWPVGPADHEAEIRPFIESRLNGRPMLKGAAFYQLTKTEPTVQDHKKILIRDKTSQAIYFGSAARNMLGLPAWGSIRLAPGNHGNFDIFIQSTSVNRKLQKGTSLVYWENVGVKYKEGPSAR